jgi:hypothetical protein
MLGKNRNMGVHGNMLERTYINMLGKFRNMEIQSNMLAKKRNIGHWWRFSGFFNMPNGAFLSCLFPAFGRDPSNPGRRTQTGKILPV